MPPSFLPRDLLLSIFPLLEDGGGGLTLGAGVHRAICMFYMDSAAQLRPPVYIHPEREMDSFFYVIYFDCSTHLFSKPVNKGTAIKKLGRTVSEPLNNVQCTISPMFFS